MKITLFAHLSDWSLEASVSGDVITINDEDIDLSGIPEGYRLPADAVGNKFFDGPWFIERHDGVLHFNLRLPVKENSPEEYRNPIEPIVLDVTSGVIEFPDTTQIEPTIDLVTEEVTEDGGLEQVTEG